MPKNTKAATRPIDDPPFQPDGFYTIAQFAEAMSVAPRTVYDWIADGSLKAMRFRSGRGRRLRGSTLNRFVAECEGDDE